jgi:hypothetical protein
MAVIVNPNAVRSNLTFYVDAANPKSYPGTGTTWYDLSGNNRHATIMGTTTFDSAEKRINLGTTTQTTNYISAPTSISQGLTEWTLEFVLERNNDLSLDAFRARYGV